MSIVDCDGAAAAAGAGSGGAAAAALVGDAGRAPCFVGTLDEDVVFWCPAGKGFGAANFDRSFETFWPLWLGFFWCVTVADLVVVVFCFEEISRAAICLVTAPTEVMLESLSRLMLQHCCNSNQRVGQSGHVLAETSHLKSAALRHWLPTDE